MSRTYRRTDWRDHDAAQKRVSRAADLALVRATNPAQFCQGKTGWPSKNEAHAAAKQIKQDTGKTMFPYTCPVCSLAHLTTVESQYLPD